jgi:hypothetical protein
MFMVVMTQYRGRRISGLYIGIRNAKRYFSPGIGFVEIQLDHLCIRCGLTPRFWKDCPEIEDSRLSAWIESLQSSRGRNPQPVSLIPAGNNNTFRLRMYAPNRVRDPLPVGGIA